MIEPGLRAVALVVSLLAATGFAGAQGPAEVGGVRMDDPETLSWDPSPDAGEYAVHELPLSWLVDGVLLRCGGTKVGDPTYQAERIPGPGQGIAYLVTAVSDAGSEGTAGSDSSGAERYLGGSCDSVLEKHVLDRVGFGWNEWSGDRIALLGLPAFVEEQLDPASIDESDNLDLLDRRAALEPPDTVNDLQALDLVNAVYARRQLEQRATLFWSNHFNTDYRESVRFFNRYAADPDRRRREAILLHYDELESFRSLAFSGSFRDILGASAHSRAMTVFLDTDNNIAGRPNENYARELLELHTMGVDGGYTHHDINAIARVMTGWDVCKKEPPNAASVHTPCIPNSLIGTADEPEGEWVLTFRRGQHDCGEKILFEATAYETVIPDTCGTPRDGADDLARTLDALAAHPSTARFVSTKLLREFVTDSPSEAMISRVLAVWADPTNPAGRGDLREVLRAVLAEALVLDSDAVRRERKIKTPFEHAASTFRAIRGKTNGNTGVRPYLLRMQHLLHQNPVPTGYSERGDAWIDTNGILERQNLGMTVAERGGANFGSDVITLLRDHGVPAGQGHAGETVDFYLSVLFGGAVPSGDRQEAIRYLETDDLGATAPYDNARIRETVGLLLGWPEFSEQ